MNEKVMICTPGRLLEHLRDTRGFKEICGGIKMMVVDESDRMLDMGFHRGYDLVIIYNVVIIRVFLTHNRRCGYLGGDC